MRNFQKFSRARQDACRGLNMQQNILHTRLSPWQITIAEAVDVSYLRIIINTAGAVDAA